MTGMFTARYATTNDDARPDARKAEARIQEDRTGNDAEIIEHRRDREEREPAMHLRHAPENAREAEQEGLEEKHPREEYEFCLIR